MLEHRFSHIPNYGDMTQLPEQINYETIPAPDVLVGGTPCQAFSVAGLRDGLNDPRGELTIKFVQLADAIDTVRVKNNEDECVVWWENVPGVLSSKDNAFGCFLGALAGEDSELQPAGKKWGNAGCVYGPKRAIAWRVLDAQYFGLAQRRNRVFLVASARDGFDPAKVLFEFDSLRRDIAPSRETWQETAVDAATSSGTANPVVGALCARGYKGVGNQYVSEGKLIIENELSGKKGELENNAKGFRMVAFGEYADDDSASTMKARDYKDATDLVCVHGTQDPIISMDRAHALGRNAGQENAVLIEPESYGIPGNWIGRKPENGGNAVEPMRDISPCLTSTDRHGVLPINTMTVQGRPSDDLNPRMGSGIGSPCDPQNTLTKAHMHGVFDPEIMRVRRLTPVECERLQGFPDQWTSIPWKGKDSADCPDGHRYKALGNSMAVNVMRWIAGRIEQYLSDSSFNQAPEESSKEYKEQQFELEL